MISHSDISGSRAGVTLFETMVALAILSLIVAVVATTVRPPSPRLQEAANIAELTRAVQETRLRAIQEGRVVTLDTDAVCPQARAPEFHPDGTAAFGPLCLDGRQIPIKPLTGTLGLDP